MQLVSVYGDMMSIHNCYIDALDKQGVLCIV